jgi:hypothetical protein
MSDSRRKRMLRAQIPAELERRGLGADTCKLVRWLPVDPSDPERGLLGWDFLVNLHRCGEGHIECRRGESQSLVQHFRERVTLP